MAKATSKTLAPVEPEAVEPVTPAEIASRDPRRTIGFESQTGDHAYVAAPAGWEYDRRILIDGTNHEHTATDPDGVWIYRSM